MYDPYKSLYFRFESITGRREEYVFSGKGNRAIFGGKTKGKYLSETGYVSHEIRSLSPLTIT